MGKKKEKASIASGTGQSAALKPPLEGHGGTTTGFVSALKSKLSNKVKKKKGKPGGERLCLKRRMETAGKERSENVFDL